MTATTIDASKAASNATFFAFAALAALTAVRLLLAKHLELHFDEAYYWYWSKNLQLSYFDHPPAVAWFIRAGTGLFGDTELGVRFFGQLSMMAATCLLFDAARRAFSLRSALIGVGSTQATLLLGAGSIIMTPDIPLLLFSTIILWALVRFTLAPAGSWWLIVGLAGGAALLSKYTAGLLAIAIALWLVLTPQLRRWLLRPWPLIAGLIAAAAFLPVLIWNAGHGWASFAKQGGRLARWEMPQPGVIFEYVGGQIGVITPGLFALLLLAIWIMARRGWRRLAPLDILLALWFIVPAAFFLGVSPMLRVQANWLAPAWPAAFLALASLIDRYGNLPRLRRSMFWSLLAGAAMVVLVWLYAVVPFGPNFKGDPLARLDGQRAFAADVAEFARQNGSHQIIALDYATASLLRFYAPAGLAIMHVTAKPRYSGFVAKPVSMPAVVVTRRPLLLPDRLTDRYQIGMIGYTLWREYRGKPNRQYFLFLATEALR
jgi:4-amino-4-deoxy-L-arabinose transferase-like glycosyltransferase